LAKNYDTTAISFRILLVSRRSKISTKNRSLMKLIRPRVLSRILVGYVGDKCMNRNFEKKYFVAPFWQAEQAEVQNTYMHPNQSDRFKLTNICRLLLGSSSSSVTSEWLNFLRRSREDRAKWGTFVTDRPILCYCDFPTRTQTTLHIYVHYWVNTICQLMSDTIERSIRQRKWGHHYGWSKFKSILWQIWDFFLFNKNAVVLALFAEYFQQKGTNNWKGYEKKCPWVGALLAVPWSHLVCL